MKTKAKKLLLNTAFLSSMALATGGLLMSPASAMACGRHHWHPHHRGHVRVVIWNPPRPCWRCHYWRPHYRPAVYRRVVFNF